MRGGEAVEQMQEMLTTAQIAKRYSIPEDTLRQLRFQHKGPPYYKPTRTVLYRISEVEEWLDSVKTIPQPKNGRPVPANAQSK